ncbi:uncharacterized protein BDZ83DRAFT_631472 [Colletotrichum acutatum]|uniref:Uncharacterized protein n=1 Tax=Glomerella acutata TaxID=27357 RepID=A0AAD8XED8_GLOAC|nr:uncharacterized protein BDZ83DRAFT_631472 [Colletotrichum acutatum]KAK1720207.1 hypothetical protein BDZ83DRAFT_631472 [Colletotrichum acutatum]
MIVAIYPDQPLALMVSAEDIITDMDCSFGIKRTSVEPSNSTLDNTTAQPVAVTADRSYKVYDPLEPKELEDARNTEEDPREVEKQTTRQRISADLETNKVFAPGTLTESFQDCSKESPHVIVWYCYHCSFGPCSIHMDDFCPVCQWQRNSHCEVMKMEIPDDA